MQVVQTSIFLKYKPLFSFLQRQAPNVAQELQRAYVSAARTYYETGFRRYCRSLGWIKVGVYRITISVETKVIFQARTSPTLENIVASEKESAFVFDLKRLAYGKIEGPGVTLAFQADDKTYVCIQSNALMCSHNYTCQQKEPIEALVRSIFLVLMDNTTSEYSFVTSFFALESAPISPISQESSSLMFSPTSMLSPTRGGFDDRLSVSGSDFGLQTPRPRADSLANSTNLTPRLQSMAKTERSMLDAIWKQIMDPILEYCQVCQSHLNCSYFSRIYQAFVKTTLDPTPSVIPLLTMIRLVEDIIAEVQRRNCPPLENYVFTLRLQMWPVFQKSMSEQIEALKKLAEGGGSGYFGRALTTTDVWVSSVGAFLIS